MSKNVANNSIKSGNQEASNKTSTKTTYNKQITTNHPKEIHCKSLTNRQLSSNWTIQLGWKRCTWSIWRLGSWGMRRIWRRWWRRGGRAVRIISYWGSWVVVSLAAIWCIFRRYISCWSIRYWRIRLSISIIWRRVLRFRGLRKDPKIVWKRGKLWRWWS